MMMTLHDYTTRLEDIQKRYAAELIMLQQQLERENPIVKQQILQQWQEDEQKKSATSQSPAEG